MINFLKDILNKLNDALDSDKTDAEQSFDLLYIIQERLVKKIRELESGEEWKS